MSAHAADTNHSAAVYAHVCSDANGLSYLATNTPHGMNMMDHETSQSLKPQWVRVSNCCEPFRLIRQLLGCMHALLCWC